MFNLGICQASNMETTALLQRKKVRLDLERLGVKLNHHIKIKSDSTNQVNIILILMPILIRVIMGPKRRISRSTLL